MCQNIMNDEGLILIDNQKIGTLVNHSGRQYSSMFGD